jgi:SAM-dependent methyltransferase
MLKKLIRILNKFLVYLILKVINFLLYKTKFKIIPSIDQLDKFDYDYSENTRRLVLKSNQNRFDKITIDTSLFNTILCESGRKHNTNKSPYNLVGHRSGYTGLYYLLFDKLKNKEINFAEIGIEKNASTRAWREYFDKAKIHTFEYDKNKIEDAIKDDLNETYYHEIDVRNAINIKNTFKNLNIKFDIIIDDSLHTFKEQIKIIYNVKDFLKPGAMLIIEDIYRFRKDHDEKRYYKEIFDIKDEFKKIFFVDTRHINNFTASWKCEKLLILIKNDL